MYDGRASYQKNDQGARRMSQYQSYTAAQRNHLGRPMPKNADKKLESFGKRLAALRKEAGYTQQELADEIDVSRRIIAYYEIESDSPPATLIVDLIEPLNTTADVLLGIAEPKRKAKQPDNRLLRRMQKIDKLSATKKRQLLSIIDTYIEVDER